MMSESITVERVLNEQNQQCAGFALDDVVLNSKSYVSTGSPTTTTALDILFYTITFRGLLVVLSYIIARNYAGLSI